MSVAKIVEVISQSKLSFEDAIQQGISRASETISGVTSAWVKDQSVQVANGKITGYSVTLKITFVLATTQQAAPKAKEKAKAKAK